MGVVKVGWRVGVDVMIVSASSTQPSALVGGSMSLILWIGSGYPKKVRYHRLTSSYSGEDLSEEPHQTLERLHFARVQSYTGEIAKRV